MNEFEKFHENLSGSAKKMLSEIDSFEKGVNPTEDFNKEKIIQEFDNLTNFENQHELYNLMRWAKAQKERCKTFDENLKTTVSATSAANETIYLGLLTRWSFT